MQTTAELTCSVCGATPARRFMNMRACAEHEPASILPTTCNKPLACYAACCVGEHKTSDERRAEYDEQVAAWRAHARREIMTVAHIGIPFGPRELAALQPIKLAQARARDWLLQLLVEGVNAGALVQLSSTSWRLRREGEPVQHIDVEQTPYVTPKVDTDRVERDNRYQ